MFTPINKYQKRRFIGAFLILCLFILRQMCEILKLNQNYSGIQLINTQKRY
jgi:hypothetical protein